MLIYSKFGEIFSGMNFQTNLGFGMQYHNFSEMVFPPLLSFRLSKTLSIDGYIKSDREMEGTVKQYVQGYQVPTWVPQPIIFLINALAMGCMFLITIVAMFAITCTSS
jgi:hypothetical protein